jgi:hypothetical protein
VVAETVGCEVVELPIEVSTAPPIEVNLNDEVAGAAAVPAAGGALVAVVAYGCLEKMRAVSLNFDTLASDCARFFLAISAKLSGIWYLRLGMVIIWDETRFLVRLLPLSYRR